MAVVAPSRSPPFAEPAAHDRTTTLAALADAELGEGGVRTLRLLGEAILFTLVGVVLTRALDVEQPGVLSLFLAAGALGSRAKQILRAADSQSGLRSTRDLLAVFAGITVAYAITGAWLGTEATARDFAFALEAARAGTEDLLHRRFPGAWPLLGHNLTVLGAMVTLSVVYRAYGALLALTWNACVWGLVVTSLILRSVAAESGGLTILIAGLSILPHLALEAFAFVVGGLYGASLGRRLTMNENLRFPAHGFATAALALLLASLVEANLPGRVMDHLTARSSAVDSRRWED